MKILIFAVSSLFSIVSNADKCETKTILAEDLKTSKAAYVEISKMSSDPKLKSQLSEIHEPDNESSLVYLADINNDGKKEYVFTYTGGGSAGYIQVLVFRKDGGKFIYLGEPPKPKNAGDGPWYFNWHRDPKTHQIQFLVGGCGNTFMQFDSGPDNKLERYLWKNGKTEQVSAP